MVDRLRIVQLNLAYDAALRGPAALLDRYTTLVDWSRAITAAGAEVHVVQRFATRARVRQDHVSYEFVSDGHTPMLDAWTTSTEAVRATVEASPDVVHINGLMFPGMTAALRDALPGAAIVLQDHSGHVPAAPPWPLRDRSRARWAAAFNKVDAVSVTARELASRWHAVGLPESTRTLEILESSTTIAANQNDDARARAGMMASPSLLWVGRLNENKDPFTMLDGLEQVLPELNSAACWMIYADAPLEGVVRDRIDRSRVLGGRVHLMGAVPHVEIGPYYRAADIYVSASRHEGSGYSLIEAIACGVTPVVTDIPAFRAITGSCGARWPSGNAVACANALRCVAHSDLIAGRQAARARFDEALSWPVIAVQTVAAYSDLVRRRAETPSS